MSIDNPCLTCGACCAYFRVSFYFGECVSAGGAVPDQLTVQVSPFHVAMLGTESKPARCVGLLGDVGCGVRCSMYEQRSSTCREFEASWENGEHNAHCDAARAAHGLPPLVPPLQPQLCRIGWLDLVGCLVSSVGQFRMTMAPDTVLLLLAISQL